MRGPFDEKEESEIDEMIAEEKPRDLLPVKRRRGEPSKQDKTSFSGSRDKLKDKHTPVSYF